MLLEIDPSLLETLEEKLPSNENVQVYVTLDESETIADLKGSIEKILRDASEEAQAAVPTFTTYPNATFSVKASAAYVKILVRQRNFKSASLVRPA